MATTTIKTPEAQFPAMRSDYNQNSAPQLQAIKATQPYLYKAIDAHCAQLPLNGSPLIIADFGCSTGANSSVAMSAVVAGLREKYGQEKTPSIMAVLDDVPNNSWTELFNFLNNNDDSVVNKLEGVCAVSTGRSFYKQILPDNCLHFGFSNAALHWLSDQSLKFANHCSAFFASPEEAQRIEQVAAADWENFLKARSRELLKGGVLAVIVAGKDTHPAALKMLDTLYQAASKLVDEGLITKQELIDFNIRIYGRSVEEMSNPNLLSSLGLELVQIEHGPSISLGFYDAFLKHRDGALLAEQVGNRLASGLEPSFVAALSSTRNNDEKASICQDLWKIFKDEVSKDDPKHYDVHWSSIFASFRKVD